MDAEDRLMVRYRWGDVRAFEELYERYERRVYGFCLHYLKDPDEAAEAFQDTFRRVVESRDRFEPRGRFESWLFTLARRACADRLRASRDEESLDATVRRRPSAASSASAPPPLASAGPEAGVLRRAEIRRLLARLPESQREALLLSKYQGFSYAEIAEMVDATEAAVKQRVYRALRTLAGERDAGKAEEGASGGSGET